MSENSKKRREWSGVADGAKRKWSWKSWTSGGKSLIGKRWMHLLGSFQWYEIKPSSAVCKKGFWDIVLNESYVERCIVSDTQEVCLKKDPANCVCVMRIFVTAQTRNSRACQTRTRHLWCNSVVGRGKFSEWNSFFSLYCTRFAETAS